MVSTPSPTLASPKSVLCLCDLGFLLSPAAAEAFQKHADQRGLPLKFASTGLVPDKQGLPPHRLSLTAGFAKPSSSVLYVPMEDFIQYDLVVAFDDEQFHQVSQACRKKRLYPRLCSVAQKGLSLPQWDSQPHRAYGSDTLPVFSSFASAFLENPTQVVDLISRCC